MSYPIYGMYEATIVHPPTHYLIIAWLMRLTRMPVEGAAILPVLAWLIVISILVVLSRLSVSAKLALLFAAFAGLVIWAPPSFIRPDLEQAAVWFAGLIALETARLASWDWKRLGIGAALVGLSATLHYPASASAVAIAVYGVWALRALGFRAARRALAALAFGGGLILVPYVALYVLPYWHDIRSFAVLANERGGTDWLAGFDQTRQQYQYLAQVNFGGQTLTFLASPALRLGIPVVFLTTTVLAFRRETRGIAAASAPYLLFLLFYARGKSEYYYTPEFTLYFACVAYAALLIVSSVLRHLKFGERGSLRAVAVLGFGCVVGAILLEPATLRAGGERSRKPLHEDMEIARAAGMAMLGRDRLVGMNDLGLWYTSGGRRIHFLRLDVDPIRDLSQVSLRGYLGQFDAIAEASSDSWATFNRQREAIPAWFADGLLHIRGFYFGDRRAAAYTAMAYLLLSTRRAHPEGYALRGRHIFHLRPAAHASHIFAVAICPADALPAKQYVVPWQLLTPVPGTTYPATTPRSTIVTYLDARAHYKRILEPQLEQNCRIRERVGMTAQQEEVQDLLGRWRSRKGHDHLTVLRQVEAESVLYAPPSATTPVDRPVRLARASVSTSRVVQRRPGLLRLVAPSRQYSQALVLPLESDARRKRWLKLGVRVLQGRIGICIFSPEEGCLLRRVLDGRTSLGPTYLPVPPTQRAVALYVDNDREGYSEFELNSIELVRLIQSRGRRS